MFWVISDFFHVFIESFDTFKENLNCNKNKEKPLNEKVFPNFSLEVYIVNFYVCAVNGNRSKIKMWGKI